MELFTEQTKERSLTSWASINWQTAEANVRRLQERIYRATQSEEWARVKNLQKFLARATSNKLLAIRKVTQENKGTHTAGVDGMICDTPEARLQLFQSGLNLEGYKPKPVRRVYIPKSNGKHRPLGIPTVRDRVMQAIVKAAIEPEWEARFEANSYGFRPGRSTMDAIEAIHTTLSQRTCSTWVLDADISGCFDNISHDALLEKLPVFTTTIRRWLKAGVVELGHYSDVETGTPQGGIISPLLANIALDGMERLFGAETPDGRSIQPARRKQPNKGINLIRYADDYVVTAPTKEVLESHVIPKLIEFLQTRGLNMNEAKTRIVHVSEGFNFLGFTIRRFGRKLLTMPQKDKVLTHLHKIKSYLQTHQQTPVGQVIHEVNPVIRGWANYYRHCAAKKTFSYVQHRQWWMFWRWAKRRHPNKSTRWVKQRYYREGHGWVLCNERAEIFRPTTTPITRHVKVAGRSSPYDPCLRTYWQERTKRNLARQVYQKQLLMKLKEQDYKCAMCKMELVEPADINTHHIKSRQAGGTDELENLQIVHHWCHHQHHQRSGYRVHKA